MIRKQIEIGRVTVEGYITNMIVNKYLSTVKFTFKSKYKIKSMYNIQVFIEDQTTINTLNQHILNSGDKIRIYNALMIKLSKKNKFTYADILLGQMDDVFYLKCDEYSNFELIERLNPKDVGQVVRLCRDRVYGR